MKTYRIATIPGDGIGKEVVPAGRRLLEALVATSRAFRFELESSTRGTRDLGGTAATAAVIEAICSLLAAAGQRENA